MALLWTALGLVCVCAVLAGVQAMRISYDSDAARLRLEARLTELEHDGQQARNQLDIQKVLLKQAKEWIEMEKAARATAAAAVATSAPAPGTPPY
jgi:hypothetical protein